MDIKIIPISFVPIDLILSGMVIASPLIVDNSIIYIGNISFIKKEEEKNRIFMVFQRSLINSKLNQIDIKYRKEVHDCLNLTSFVCGNCKKLLFLRERNYKLYHKYVFRLEETLNKNIDIMNPALKEAKEEVREEAREEKKYAYI